MRKQGTVVRNTTIDDLREKIQIVYYAKEVDEYGNIYNNTENVRYSVWAKVIPYASKIYNGVAEQINEIDYQIIMRYKSDIMPTDIIIYRNKKLQIISTAYDAESANKWTVLQCRELVEQHG